jgi:ubiquinone/menaquinone biosynthesis C-methylase UbiE
MVHKENGGLTVKEFFDSRADLYQCVSRWAQNETVNLKTDEFLEGIYGQIAIEIGAGTGILISRVRNFKLRIALDLSRKMLAQIGDSAVLKVVGDVHQLPLSNGCADLVICRQLLHYCDLKTAFQSIMRILNPNGWFHVVQVIDFDSVPESWDQEWASFRNVGNRRHQRRAELEKCYMDSSLRVIKREYMTVRDEYPWRDFFVKNNVDHDLQKRVREFFARTPRGIAQHIDLYFDDHKIAYNRRFGFWLLQKSDQNS